MKDESEETCGVVRDLQELDGKIVERDLQPSLSSVVSNSMNGNLEVGNTLERFRWSGNWNFWGCH